MRKIMSALTIVAAAGVLAVSNVAPASALAGNEQLGCYVTPSHVQPHPVPRFCSNNMPASSYQAAFQVLNESGTYSYAWTIPAQYASGASGCTSTTDYCILFNIVAQAEVPVSVTISQNGQSATLRATAEISPYCGGRPCLQ